MNLVKMLEDQLSGDVLDKLSSRIGADPKATGRAASAAVPTLLASLAKLGSSDDGVRKLTGVLGSLDSSTFGNITQALSGDSGSMMNKGMGLLGNLFGGSMLNSAAAAIGRYAGLDAGIVQKLISFLAPMVLGKVASQWKSQGGTASALTSLLSEQTRHIPDALPPGFSLDEVPGLAGATDAYRTATTTTRRAAETAERAAPSMASWLLPLAAVLVGAFILWNMFKSQPGDATTTAQGTTTSGERVTVMKPALPDTPNMPNIPSATQLTEKLSTTFKSLTETLASIKDAASAEAAAPKLEELSATIDSTKKMLAQIPEAARGTLDGFVKDQLNPIKEQAQKTLSMPGLSDRIKLLIDQIVRKLEEWNVVQTTR